jgi:hypothetical protein
MVQLLSAGPGDKGMHTYEIKGKKGKTKDE